jgi:uncharacterized protein (DUF433 family)
MAEPNNYKHLEARPRSNYRQLFVKGLNLRAEVLYRETIGVEPRTPEEVARDYRVPLEAVQEAIDYSLKHEPLLREERERTLARMQARGLERSPLVPPEVRPGS